MSCKAIEPCLRHSVSRSCGRIHQYRITWGWRCMWEAKCAHLDVEVVVDLDHLPEYAYPLVQICEVERVPELMDQRFLLALLCRRDVGLAQRPLP